MSYPLATRAQEFERLHIQSMAMAPEAVAMLERMGVQAGWTCLDLGCGPCGIAPLVSPIVGSAGRVIGLDRNESFLEVARRNAPANVEFQQGDAYATGFPEASFDLVHMRFLASTAGAPERLLQEAIRITRPGGTVALQEPDGSTLNCYPPNVSWDRLKAAFLGAFAGVGADLKLASRLYHLARHAGLEDVQYRTFLVAVRAQDPLVDYLPSTIESLYATVIKLGLLTEAELPSLLADCRDHLRQPDTSFTMYTVAQVWGRCPRR